MVVLHVFPSSSAAENCFCHGLPFSLCFSQHPLDISVSSCSTISSWHMVQGAMNWLGNRASPGTEELIPVGPVWSFGPVQDSLIFHEWLIWCNGFQMQYFWGSLLSTCRNSLYFCPGVLAKLEVGINCCSFSQCTFPRRVVDCIRALSWKAASPSFAVEILKLWTVDSCISVDYKCRELAEYEVLGLLKHN